MSDYPTSEELQEIEEDLQEFMDTPTVKQLKSHKEKLAANSESFGQMPDFSEMPDYTYADPYDIMDVGALVYCETAEFNPNTGNVDIIVVDANDVNPLFEAMARTDYASTLGTLRLFHEKNVTNTTQVSQFFAEDAMNKVYDQYLLKPHILSNPSKVGNANVVNVNFNTKESWTYVFGAANKDFHSTFHKNFLVQMNHRITQEAVEKNRNFFANGTQRNPDHMRDSFTWDKFQKMAKQCAEDAFKRTQHMMIIQKTNNALETIKTYAKSFKKLEPKIKEEYVIKSFDKEFKLRKNESLKQAIPRIKSELKSHANKRFDELKNERGIDRVLAQGLAQARGSKTVTVAHIKEANEMYSQMKKNPAVYRSLSKIFEQVTGNDKAAKQALIHSMDGRSSNQRNRKTLEIMGAHLYANSQGRTRVLKGDKIHGQAFAATATLGVPPKRLKDAREEAYQAHSYDKQDVIKARQQMAKAAGRVKDERGKDTSRDELLKRAEPVQQVKDKPVEPKRGPDDDDGGYTPDGSGGRRRRR